MMRCRFTLLILASGLCGGAGAQNTQATATYLANEGVMITFGDTKVLFDALFNQGFNQYELLPRSMEASLMAGDAPFDGVDAVFVSHYHGDHFSAGKMLAYLRAQRDVVLYAPMQAVSALRDAGAEETILERVTGLALDVGDEPFRLEAGALAIDAVRIPHSGWPTRRTDIENVVFRVTLGDAVTVAHFGDADTTQSHYATHPDYWTEVTTHLALPPYWFFLSADGRTVLDDVIDPRHAVGVHVPTSVPDDPAARPPDVDGVDLFTRPGETRSIEQ